jgi:hypothetical protein
VAVRFDFIERNSTTWTPHICRYFATVSILTTNTLNASYFSTQQAGKDLAQLCEAIWISVNECRLENVET